MQLSLLSQIESCKVMECNPKNNDAFRQEALDLLIKLIGFDSQVIDQGAYGKEAKIQEYLYNLLTNMGAEVTSFEPDNKLLEHYEDFNPGHRYENRPNVVAVFRGTGEGRSILLNGHVDTVSVGREDLWETPPHTAIIDGDLLKGLGASDMKGGVSAQIMAIRLLQKRDCKLKGDIVLQCVVDEEGGGNGTLACVERGYRADVALVAEPTELQICSCHRGALHFEIEVIGKSSHTSVRDKGANAIEKMHSIMDALTGLDDRWAKGKTHRLLPPSAITFTGIEGGSGASMVPDRCKLKVNVKYLPTEVLEDVKNEIEKCISDSAKKDKWLVHNPPRVTWLLHTTAYETDTANPIVNVLQKACRDNGVEGILSGMPSGTDARLLNNVGNIPTFIFGPGSLSSAHQPNEFLSISEYLSAANIYADVIRSWCN